ncbi:MAG: DUF721 domain-containing protein [Verrucomicrobiales bacterium]|nr:DUF721 domain-containing protein [Verrucomicrobiales bacterium]
MNRGSRLQERKRALLSAWRRAPEPPPPLPPARGVDQLLRQVLVDLKLEDRAHLEEVLEVWREVVGDFLFDATRPDTLTRGTLTVRLLQPAVHHALMMEKPRILNRLRQRLAHVGVKDLRFRHG